MAQLMNMLFQANLQVEWISLAAVQLEAIRMIDDHEGHVCLAVAHTQNAVVKVTPEGNLLNDDDSIQQVLHSCADSFYFAANILDIVRENDDKSVGVVNKINLESI